jgi:hypothetical protein
MTVNETVSDQKAAAESLSGSPVEERPDEGVFILPGGYVDAGGALHYEVELSPLTGHDEEYLANVRSNNCSASVVTGLLSRCLKRIGSRAAVNSSLVRDLLVGDRDYLIIRLRQISFGAKVDAVMRCPNSLCGTRMDVTFSLDDIQIERKTVAARFFTMQLSSAAAYHDRAGGEHREVEFRLPTGADQESAAPVFRLDKERGLARTLARCIRRIGDIDAIDEAFVASLPVATRNEIEIEMERRAPQVEIELDARCPECRTAFESAFDFTAFFALEMPDRFQDLERAVHFLARHYHWSEQEILSLTRRKRRRYVELLEEELNGFN